MVKKVDTNKARLRRHKRVRGKISGTAECPRLNVFRSSANIYAQIIDDTKGVTLCSASKEAEAILKNTPKAACEYLEKLLKSAVANAINNFEMDEDKLYVSECFATSGPILKRMRPRAQGRQGVPHRQKDISCYSRSS